MTIRDITQLLGPSTPVWPGDTPPTVTRTSSIEAGDLCTTSSLSLSAHVGTHIDAPCHVLGGGGDTEAISLAVLVGRCVVVSAGAGRALSAADLSRLLPDPAPERLLLRFAAGVPPDADDWAGGLLPDAADLLVGLDVRLVGVSGPSVEPPGDVLPVHLRLLGAGVVILEGIDLSGVPDGHYQLVCAPLRWEGLDGAPCRALLLEA
ncbi:MAG: cyclase family protein [Armatimonadetes bacterium]|nr:cyclase family protein [Armatimonadota bacterium]